jgi:glycosyltransferase involved in cell wall biosynthesis
MLFNQPDGEIRPVDNWGREHSGFDTIVFHRWPHRLASDVIHKAQAFGQRVLVDIDDWLLGVAASNEAASFWKREQESADEGRRFFMQSLAVADAVICSTDYLARRLEPRVPVPMVVAHNMCKLADWVQYPVRDRPPVFGWAGTTNLRSGDLEVLRGVLGPFLERHDLRFAHLGYRPQDPPIAPMLGIDDRRVELHPALPLTEYHRAFEVFDVGLAPLADHPFNLAKSWLKPLEYACAGVPCLASDVGEYKHGAGIIRSRTPNQWRANLEWMVEGRYRRAVREAQLTFVQCLDISQAWSEWAHALVNFD